MGAIRPDIEVASYQDVASFTSAPEHTMPDDLTMQREGGIKLGLHLSAPNAVATLSDKPAELVALGHKLNTLDIMQRMTTPPEWMLLPSGLALMTVDNLLQKPDTALERFSRPHAIRRPELLRAAENALHTAYASFLDRLLARAHHGGLEDGHQGVTCSRCGLNQVQAADSRSLSSSTRPCHPTDDHSKSKLDTSGGVPGASADIAGSPVHPDDMVHATTRRRRGSGDRPTLAVDSMGAAAEGFLYSYYSSTSYTSSRAPGATALAHPLLLGGSGQGTKHSLGEVHPHPPTAGTMGPRLDSATVSVCARPTRTDANDWVDADKGEDEDGSTRGLLSVALTIEVLTEASAVLSRRVADDRWLLLACDSSLYEVHSAKVTLDIHAKILLDEVRELSGRIGAASVEAGT